MESRLLRYFVAVAEEGTVSGAAEELRMTQPALSRQIKQLEAQSRLTLFERSGVRLALTSEGQEFLAVAREVLQAHDHAEQIARTLAEGRLSSVSVAAPRTTLIDIVAPFVATFGEPDPVPQVIEAPIEPDLARLTPSYDLVVTTRRPPRCIASRPLARLPVWAYVPAGHPWARRHSVTLAELASEQLILTSHDFKSRHLIDAALHLNDLTPAGTIEALHGRVAQALAAAGRGVAVLTDDPHFDLVPLTIETGMDITETDGGTAAGGLAPPSAPQPQPQTQAQAQAQAQAQWTQPQRTLSVHLYAAWRTNHHAAEALESLASRLQDFCEQRYGKTLPGRAATDLAGQ